MDEPRGYQPRDARDELRWLTVPVWSVYTLGGLLVAIGLALPWLARSQGVLRFKVPEQAGELKALRPALIALPGGEFVMGSPESEEGRDSIDEGPQHPVTVSPFYICQTEVTQEEWEAVMGTALSDCDYGCGDDRPVQSVSWLDAVAYLNALTERENGGRSTKLTTCYEIGGENVEWNDGCTGYRLPTEAEWEYAARAGTETAYSFGNEVSKLGDHAWYSENAGGEVQPVGTKMANPWGLHDMHGNVYEWVWDWYGGYKAEATRNPLGQKSGVTRVLRGGSFNLGPLYLRSADRFWLDPGNWFVNYGFRCARGGAPALSR